jgi:hypothetical protein
MRDGGRAGPDAFGGRVVRAVIDRHSDARRRGSDASSRRIGTRLPLGVTPGHASEESGLPRESRAVAIPGDSPAADRKRVLAASALCPVGCVERRRRRPSAD